MSKKGKQKQVSKSLAALMYLRAGCHRSLEEMGPIPFSLNFSRAKDKTLLELPFQDGQWFCGAVFAGKGLVPTKDESEPEL